MNLPLWKAILLAIVQGLTEFLPVSSKSHLMVAEKLLGVHVDSFIALAVLLHFGTLISLLIYYRRDWIEMLRGLFRTDEAGLQARRLLGMLVLGTIPVALVGVLAKDRLENLYQNLTVTGALWLVTAALLWYADRLSGKKGLEETRPVDAVWVGLAQAAAILPGISRSGSTIFGGLARGLADEWAPRFAFLLSGPAVLGATALKAKDLVHALHHGGMNAGPTPWATYVVACVVSAVVGYGAIALTIRAVRASQLKYFALWCVFMGLVAIVWGLRGG